MTAARQRLSPHAGRVLRFAGVGVANTGSYYAAYLLLGRVLPYLLAHLVATALSMIGSYLLNCRFTFHVRPSWRTFALFPLSNLANILITTIGLPIAVDVLGIDERIAPLPVQLTAIPVTYLVAHTIMTAGRATGQATGRATGQAAGRVTDQATGRPNPDRTPV